MPRFIRSNFSLPRLTLPVAAMAALIPGCDDTDGTDAESSPSCEDVATAIVGLDTASPAGISGNQLLALANGEHPLPIHAVAGSESGLDFTPKTPLGELTLSIAHAGGDLRHVVSTIKPCDASECAAIHPICGDYVELDVVVGFRTADGAFAETWNAVLRADDPTDPENEPAGTMGTVASVSGPIDEDQLAGSFTITDINAPDDAEDVKVELNWNVTFDGINQPRGSIHATIEYTSGDTATAGRIPLFSWPNADPHE